MVTTVLSGILIVLKLRPDEVGTVIHALLTEHEADSINSEISSSEKLSSTAIPTVKQAGLNSDPVTSSG